ncbi:MAG TPA: DUF192 domain-containing protein [Opitutaceae bacterium]|nr:DUF192 domain-containing protein [Opitutaceae bacterium]
MFWSILREWSWAGGAGVLALLLAACARPGPAAAGVPKTVDDWFAIRVGDRTVQMQLAITEPERDHGLMGRKDLGPDQGMLFVFAAPMPLNFWMRNTPLPLDIGYFSPAGELKEIYPMYPYDETTVGSRDRHLLFALEMRQGWFAANGVRPGARLDLAAVKAALQARGAAPADYGLP